MTQLSMKRMRRLAPLFFALLLCSCSAKWHIDQAIKKGAIIKSDTVYTDRVVITPGDSTTVYVPFNKVRDTTIYQDRIAIRYSTKHDTVRIHVVCPPDTVVIKVPVSVNTEIDCPPRSPFWRNLALALLVVTVVVLFFKRN